MRVGMISGSVVTGPTISVPLRTLVDTGGLNSSTAGPARH